jgi:hypothetical protein
MDGMMDMSANVKSDIHALYLHGSKKICLDRKSDEQRPSRYEQDIET